MANKKLNYNIRKNIAGDLVLCKGSVQLGVFLSNPRFDNVEHRFENISARLAEITGYALTSAERMNWKIPGYEIAYNFILGDQEFDVEHWEQFARCKDFNEDGEQIAYVLVELLNNSRVVKTYIYLIKGENND